MAFAKSTRKSRRNPNARKVRVRAIEEGFYDAYRKVGAEFFVEEGHVNATWFEPVDGGNVKTTKPEENEPEENEPEENEPEKKKGIFG